MKPASGIALVAIVGALLLFRQAAAPTASVAWLSFEEGAAAAKASQKPVLVDFGATWCGVCVRLDRTTLRDATVAQHLAETWVPVKVDVDRDPERAREFQIEALPTLVLLAPDGTILARRRGYVSPSSLIAWLAANRPTT